MLSEAEKSQIFGNMLAKSRNDAGKTQRYMAQALQKSVNTICTILTCHSDFQYTSDPM